MGTAFAGSYARFCCATITPSPRAASFNRTAAPPATSMASICSATCAAVSRFGSAVPAAAASAETAAPAPRIGIVGVVLRLHLLIVAPLGGQIEIHRNHRRLAHQHRFALHLRLVGLHPLFHFRFGRPQSRRGTTAPAAPAPAAACRVRALCRRWWRPLRRHHLDRRRGDRTFRRRRPCQHFEFQILLHRRHDERARPLVAPSRMAEVPRLQADILEAPVGQLLRHPLRCRLVVGRARNARTVPVRQHVERVHDLRLLQFFTAEAGIGSLIHLLLRCQQTTHGKDKRELFHMRFRIA